MCSWNIFYDYMVRREANEKLPMFVLNWKPSSRCCGKKRRLLWNKQQKHQRRCRRRKSLSHIQIKSQRFLTALFTFFFSLLAGMTWLLLFIKTIIYNLTNFRFVALKLFVSRLKTSFEYNEERKKKRQREQIVLREFETVKVVSTIQRLNKTPFKLALSIKLNNSSSSSPRPAMKRLHVHRNVLQGVGHFDDEIWGLSWGIRLCRLSQCSLSWTRKIRLNWAFYF